MSAAPATGCDSLKPWVAGAIFVGGEKVIHRGQKFECRPWPYAPWCALETYEPGNRQTPWPDAWLDKGTCAKPAPAGE